MRIINGLASRKEVMEPYGGLKFSQLDQAEVTEGLYFICDLVTALYHQNNLENCLFFTDLKAFERRLTEYVGCIGPQTGKWRRKFLSIFLCNIYFFIFPSS